MSQSALHGEEKRKASAKMMVISLMLGHVGLLETGTSHEY